MNRIAILLVSPALAAIACTPTKTDGAPAADASASSLPSPSTTDADAFGRYTVAEKDSVRAVAIDDATVYFTTDWTTTALRRAARHAGAPPATVCTLPKRITGEDNLLVDEGNIWIATPTALFRAAKSAGSDAACPKVADLAAVGMVKLGKTVFVAAKSDQGTSVVAFDDAFRMRKATEIPEAPAALSSDGKSLFLATGGPFTTNVHKLDGSGRNPVATGTAGDELQAAEGGHLYSLKGFTVVDASGKQVGGGHTSTFLVVGKTLYADAKVSAKAPSTLSKKTLGSTTVATPYPSLPGTVYGLAADKRDLYVAAGGMLLRFAP